MEQQFLLVILGSAAAALAVAAALGVLRSLGRGAGGWTAGALAMGAALFVASRLELGAWPSFPPTQAIEWTPWLGAAGALGLLVTSWLPERRWWVRPLAAGAAVSVVTVGWTLSRALSRIEPAPARITCGAAVVLSMLSVAAVVGAAFQRAGASDPAGASAVQRLRDRHWPTLTLGLVLAAGAPAMLFAAHFKRVMDFDAALACALGGVALVGWLVHRRMNLAGAGVVGGLVYAALWWVGLFYGGSDEPPVLGLVFALAAPLALIIGTWGPLTRRAGWARLVVTVVAAVGLVAVALAVHGPLYIRELREMQP